LGPPLNGSILVCVQVRAGAVRQPGYTARGGNSVHRRRCDLFDVAGERGLARRVRVGGPAEANWHLSTGFRRGMRTIHVLLSKRVVWCRRIQAHTFLAMLPPLSRLSSISTRTTRPHDNQDLILTRHPPPHLFLPRTQFAFGIAESETICH
jgi:hypothetical protein